MCAYEKLREKNIKEGEKAMFESGFFEDLDSYKKKMGLISNNEKKEKILRCIPRNNDAFMYI